MQNNYSAFRRLAFQNAEGLVAKYHASGLTQRQFAEQHGLKLSTLRQWIYRPSSRQRRGRTSPPAFQELALPLLESWAAELRLPSGRVLRLNPQASAEWVGTLVERLS